METEGLLRMKTGFWLQEYIQDAGAVQGPIYWRLSSFNRLQKYGHRENRVLVLGLGDSYNPNYLACAVGCIPFSGFLLPHVNLFSGTLEKAVLLVFEADLKSKESLA